MATRGHFSAGANAPGWVVPLPDVRLEFVACCGEPCEIISHRLGQLWQEEEHGVPNGANAGNGERYGCVVPRRLGLSVTARLHVCCGETIFDPVPKSAMQMRVPWRPSVGVGTVRRCGLAFVGSEESSRTAQTTGRAGVRGEENAEKSPHLDHLRHRVAWISLRPPLSARAAPLPSSAVATRGRGSSLSPALPPWTPASRKKERDTWDMGVLLRFRTEGQRAETWSHGAKPQKKKAPRGRQVHI